MTSSDQAIANIGITNPIFIFGVERSGTTLLYSILSNHPDLYWFSRLDSVMPGMPTVACTIRRFFDALSDETYIAIPDTISRSHGIISPSECLPYWRNLFRWGDEDDYQIDDDRFDETDLDDSLRGWIVADVQKRLMLLDKKRLLVKQPGFSLKIRYFDALFPDALFIHMVRHPRVNLASLVRTKDQSSEIFWGTKVPGWRRYLDASPARQAAFQMQSVAETVERDIEAIDDAGSRYLQVKYEDLTDAPEETIRRVLAFCRLDVTAEIEQSLAGIRARERKAIDLEVTDEVRAILNELADRDGYDPM